MPQVPGHWPAAGFAGVSDAGFLSGALRFVNRLGLEASSGYGVACKIVNFAMLIPSSLMQSMASFVSQNVGAGNKKRARQTLFTGIAIGLVFGCAVFALVWFEGDLLSGIFTTDAPSL